MTISVRRAGVGRVLVRWQELSRELVVRAFGGDGGTLRLEVSQ